MRASHKHGLRVLAFVTVAALILVGCNNSSPTEPKVVAAATPAPTPTPLPPGGSVAGTWTGTYNPIVDQEDIAAGCDPNGTYLAQGTFQQDGANVRGTVSSPGRCSLDAYGAWVFTGTLQGNTLSGSVVSTSNFQFNVTGVLTGSTLDIRIIPAGGEMGQLHLHR